MSMWRRKRGRHWSLRLIPMMNLSAAVRSIAWLRAKGRRVRIVVVTDGAVPGKPNSKEIAATRQNEVRDAGRALGVPDDDVVFLNFPDEGCDTRISGIESALEQQIRGR